MPTGCAVGIATGTLPEESAIAVANKIWPSLAAAGTATAVAGAAGATGTAGTAGTATAVAGAAGATVAIIGCGIAKLGTTAAVCCCKPKSHLNHEPIISALTNL